MQTHVISKNYLLLLMGSIFFKIFVWNLGKLFQNVRSKNEFQLMKNFVLIWSLQSEAAALNSNDNALSTKYVNKLVNKLVSKLRSRHPNKLLNKVFKQNIWNISKQTSLWQQSKQYRQTRGQNMASMDNPLKQA